MPTKLGKSIIILCNAKQNVNIAVTDFKIAQKMLMADIKRKVFADDKPDFQKFAKYQSNIYTINRAKLDELFPEYQRLDTLDKQIGPDGKRKILTGKFLTDYQTLVNHFSDYESAIKDTNISLVKTRCVERLNHAQDCSKGLVKSIVDYKGFRAVALFHLLDRAARAGFPKECNLKALSLLNLYSSLDSNILCGRENIERLSLSDRLNEIAVMIKTGIFGEWELVEGLKSDCIYQVEKRLLMREKQVEIKPFDIRIMNLYRYQITDITAARVITTLEDVNQLIENAAINNTMVRHLAAIKMKELGAGKIASEVVEMLVRAFGIDKDEADSSYALPIDSNGHRVASEETLKTIKSDISRMQQGSHGAPPYVPIREFLFSENETGVVELFKEVDQSYNDEMTELETPA